MNNIKDEKSIIRKKQKIIRDKIKNAPNLQLEEMNAFMRIADMEMSNFNMNHSKMLKNSFLEHPIKYFSIKNISR